jgi:hypothetical protein
LSGRVLGHGGSNQHLAAFQLETQRPLREPEFDFQLIRNLHGLVLEGEAGLKDHFVRSGAKPLRIVYEDFVGDYEGPALNVLRFLTNPEE